MEFSRRTAWDRRLNRIALRIESLKAQGSELIDLTESNPTRCGFDYPEQAIAAAFRSAELTQYAPDPKGLASARSALASHLAQSGARVDPRQIILCSGTSEAYAYLFKLLCDPGDNVLVPNPSYPLFEFLTGLESVNLRSYPMRFAGRWALEVSAIANACDNRTRGLLAINPGNPTGSFLKSSELDLLSAFCAKRGFALIVDEVFSDYGFGAENDRVRTVLDRESAALTFALSGLSKKGGMPQLKVGWLCVSGPTELKDEALGRLEIIADTYLSSSPVAQAALPRLLEVSTGIQQQIRQRVAENRSELLARRPFDARWTALPVEGGWYAVLQLAEDANEESLCLELLDRGVIVHPGYFFDFPQGKFLVLSLIIARSEFAQGLGTLISFLE